MPCCRTKTYHTPQHLVHISIHCDKGGGAGASAPPLDVEKTNVLKITTLLASQPPLFVQSHHFVFGGAVPGIQHYRESSN